MMKSSVIKTRSFTRNLFSLGDVIIMPNNAGIAIGIAKKIEFRDDLEWKDTIKVEWKTKWYPRKDLTSNFQSKLKFRGAFLNLNDLASEIEGLINSDFISLTENYTSKTQYKRNENIKTIAEHINQREGTFFQDIEFEKFILELFKLKYNGFEGYKNSQRMESKDGKDLYLTYEIEDLDLIVELNIQVKQHKYDASFAGVFQINKGKENNGINPVYVSKNILVTSGNVNEDFKKRALEEKVYVFGPVDIAEMILDNYSELTPIYLHKLNIYNELTILD